MSTNIFTNEGENSLLKKFNGVFDNMTNLYAFRAVVGYFRASGYFAVREHLMKVPSVKILVGIDVDHIVGEAQRKGLLFTGDDDKTRQEFINWIEKDIKDARYAKNVESGILAFIDDIINKRLEIRAHKSKQLHAKIYIFLPETFNEHTDGRLITGSSNLTSAGLGAKKEANNYEFNVEIKDYSNVKFALDEFEKLWVDSTDILPENFQSLKENSHIDKLFTPFEIYIKFLIEYFGRTIEYDPETVGDVPQNFKKLSYQIDAVNQGFQMLMEHNGFFLADVVGTGKTVVAAMLAKRFIIANGTQHTKILVVYPPQVEKNWKRTFRQFNIDRYTKFITNGSLDKIIEDYDTHGYWPKEDYDLILVDEAHKFRNHTSQAFQSLQIICKAGRQNNGNIESEEKKVVLISATPLNNRPHDIYYLLQLFQDARRSTLPETNLQSFFAGIIDEYKIIKNQDVPDMDALRNLYSRIRHRVLEPITIRRTRRDLETIDRYKEDLIQQGIRFPEIEPPYAIEYQLDKKLNLLFYQTIHYLTDEHAIKYFRYQAIGHLKKAISDEFYESPATISMALAGIMKTMLVKRLESSFYAFKKSLTNFKNSTSRMVEMFEKGKVYIAPDLDINRLIDDGWSDEEIEARILEISDDKPENRVFDAGDFDDRFLEGLKHDLKLLTELCAVWDTIDYDPKFDRFLEMMRGELFDDVKNPTKKLVIFSESKDTTDYLTQQLTANGFQNLLSIDSTNRKNKFEIILENFDANYDKEKKNDFNIIISTEVLAEGVNLHRANVIVNYDTPWNATRLMQRIGRVNRIGSVAGKIYNYNFYPSSQGNDQIQLKKTSLLKLQGFHTAFGEDAQIYTLEEIIEIVKLYKDGMPEDEDMRLRYLEFIRNFKENQPEEFKRIKKFPVKARTGRKANVEKNHSKLSICLLKSEVKKEIYRINKDNTVYSLTFEEAVKIFEAKQNEKAFALPDFHYDQINKATEQYEAELTNDEAQVTAHNTTDARANYIKKFLRDIRSYALNDSFEDAYKVLIELIETGTFTNLITELDRIRKKVNNKKKPLSLKEAEKEIIRLKEKYSSRNQAVIQDDQLGIINAEPEIIISETFID
ncbi:MAG: DEAD/DEAH box helicase family protein [Bacteroidia bacterium]|nr:DEAD/DEAH box helicase family protein [Bacteroidia bacterium]